jgi:hypothetical protein
MKKGRKPKGQFELTITSEAFTLMGVEYGAVEAGNSITLTEKMLDLGIKNGLYQKGHFNAYHCEPIPYAGWPQRFYFLKTNYEGFDKRDGNAKPWWRKGPGRPRKPGE